jgi:predicted nucleic acid-binding protein
VLACAIAAHAELIISGDADLLVLKYFEHIPIVTSMQALQRFSLQ